MPLAIPFNEDGREVLVPTVAPDGSDLSTEAAVAQYQQTGKHLGIFDTPANANAFAATLPQDKATLTAALARPAAAPAAPTGAAPGSPAAQVAADVAAEPAVGSAPAAPDIVAPGAPAPGAVPAAAATQQPTIQPIPTRPPTAAVPTAAPAPPPNRSGLPMPAEVWQRIQADPTLRNEAERAQAFAHAETIYRVTEAAQAQQERIRLQAEQQQLRDAETAIYADVYSATPKITPQQIALDPRFNSNPERRKQMIELVNNPPGSGVPAAQSYKAALDLISRIRLPDGDPNKVNDVGPIYDAAVGGQLNKSDFDFVKKQFDEIRTPGGEILAKRKGDFLKAIEPQIDKSAFSGIPDLKGKSRFYEFQYMLDQKVDEYRKAGKNPVDLIDPSKPDYMGKPETLAPYKRTLDELINDMPGAGAAKGKLDISTPDKLKAAVSAGTISREQGEAEALRQGWIRAAPPPIPPSPQGAPVPLGP